MILTRYLYDKGKVETSLKVAIKNHYYQEANFWAYELYFSGFQTTVLDILHEIYTSLFSENHPKLGTYIQMKKATNTPELIATIIKNLTMKNPEIKETPNTKFVNVKKHHIEPFMTKEPEDLPFKKPWQFLRQVCEYRVLGDATKREIAEFRGKWLDISVKSPIWLERITQYNGNIEDGVVVFNDEERFYDKYGYEPDEQSLEIQMNCIGILVDRKII